MQLLARVWLTPLPLYIVHKVLSTAPPDKPYGENISFIRAGKMHRKEEESVGQNEPAATNAPSIRSLL
jgi:hypothetical protein